MKKYLVLLLACFALSSVLVPSCKKKDTTKPEEVAATETTYVTLPAPAAEKRNVLIEIFTGVRSVNCPNALKVAAAIAENNPNRIQILSIYPKGKLSALTNPFDSSMGDPYTSKYDFRSESGARIYEQLGPSISLPAGCVNRKLYPGEASRLLDYQKWAATVTDELNMATPVNIAMTAKNTDDVITIDVTLKYTANVSDAAHYLTIALTESNLLDCQETRDSSGTMLIQPNYEHKHVLRAVASTGYGDFLNGSLETGRVFVKRYTVKCDSSWVKSNLDVIGIVHLNSIHQTVVHTREVHVN